MKKLATVAVMAALAFGLSACGGSDSGSTGGGGTGTTTTTKAQTADFKVVQASQAIWGKMLAAPKSETVKSTPSGTCTDACTISSNQVSCTICGTTGSCTGTYDATASVYQLTFTLACTNYQDAETGILIDGSTTLDMKINQNFAGNAMVIKTADSSKTSSNQCDYFDDSTSTSPCTTSAQACGASDSDFFFSLLMTIGSTGLHVVDPNCTGVDETIAAGSTLTEDTCISNFNANPLVIRFSWSGTGDFAGVNSTSSNMQCSFNTSSGV